MAKRNFRAHVANKDSNFQSNCEITSMPVAVYYRQSTTAQVGNISTSIQTIDMVQEMERRGWNKEHIILIDADEGVSGTKRIDEREGMSALFELIADRKIGAVACQDEDRLFRDVTQIQVNVFIDVCRKSNVRVVTPFFTYDFADPMQGEFHARQFRFKCDMAAEYLKSYVLGRLAPARQRLLRDGKWAGARMPVGFMVDNRKLLLDGKENPNWRKYVPFEPYAKVVREYFKIFVECNGAIRKSMRKIRERGLGFPNIAPPDGFKISYQLKNRGDGNYLTRSNLVRLLTNPVYVGHWCYQGAVIRWNNHEPIVEEAQFHRVFNMLSRYTLEGEENQEYRPAYQHVPSSEPKERNTQPPLLIGLLYTQINGKFYRTGQTFEKKNSCYLYVQNKTELEGTRAVWTRRSSWIDEAVINRFKQRLLDTYNDDTWTRSLVAATKLTQRERKIKQIQLTSITEDMDNLVLSLKTLSHAHLIRNVEQRYVQLEREKQRYENEIAALDNDQARHVSLEQAAVLFKHAIQDWDIMTLDERRGVLALFIDRIEASNYSRDGAMTLRVFWKDADQEDIKLWHKPHAEHWTRGVVEHLLDLFDKGANQLEIAAEFPDLAWQQLLNEIKKHRGLVRFSPSWLGNKETYRMYEASGGRKGKASGSYWRPEELENLKEMVESGATQIELMQEYPYRRWVQLKYRINEVMGRKVKIELSGIGQRLTYLEYAQQQNIESSDPSSEIAGRNF